MIGNLSRRCGAVCALAFATVLLAAPAAAETVVQFAADHDGIEIVDATVGGQQGKFLFDSGIGVSVVTPSVAKMIRCIPWGKITGFRATGERLDLQRCNATRASIGGIDTTLPEIAVLDLTRVMGPLSAGLSGALGLDALAGRTVTLDVAHHRLVIEDAASVAAIGKNAEAAPIRLVRDAEGAALTVDIAVPTPSGLAWMELDTGNYGPSLVDKSLAGLFGLDPNITKPQQWQIALPGVAAVSGPVVVKDLILEGNLGRSVLGHWLVTLDLATGRGWIRMAAIP